MAEKDEILFEVETPLGFSVRTTEEYWRVITEEKHSAMINKLEEVQLTLMEPDEIRQSKIDPRIYLFYRPLRPRRWICAVAKSLNGTGFLVTTYVTNAIKEGERIWNK
jgi:hypothetical protein